MSETLEANKAVILELFEAWGAGNFDRVRELVDLNGEWWTLANRKTRLARDQLVRVQALNEETIDGTIDFRVHVLTAEENRVAAVVESEAHFAEQGRYNNLYHFLFQLADGRVTRAWLYYDTALANRVLRGDGTSAPPLASHAND